MALDDFYATVQDDNFSGDRPGVLENDTDPEDDALTAILVDSSQASGVLMLFSDGSFEYEPASGFVGTDIFTYKANDGTSDSNIASVTFTVSAGTATAVFTDETIFLDALAALGAVAFGESFEDDVVWAASRNSTTPQVTSQGVTWTSNNDTSEISTGPGPALDGAWGFFSIPHGNYDAGPECAQPGVCTDGWKCSSPQKLIAAGGWVKTGTPYAGMNVILDDDFLNPFDFGDVVLSTGYVFFGIIDPDGFNSVEFRETEGKYEDAKLIFGDDFTFAFQDPSPWTDLGQGLAGTHGVPLLVGAGTLLGGEPFSLTLTQALENNLTFLAVGFSQINVPFKGGTFVPDISPPGLLLPRPTDATGSIVIGGSWLPGVPSGLSLFFQYWIPDAGGPFGFAASNALQATTP